METIIFNGISKRIKIEKEVTKIDVGIDLYSNWKRWAQDNANFEQAFRTFGGDPTTTGQVAPQYFFLLNGWRVEGSDVHVLVEGNLYTDNGDSPFILDETSGFIHKTSDVAGSSSDELLQTILERIEEMRPEITINNPDDPGSGGDIKMIQGETFQVTWDFSGATDGDKIEFSIGQNVSVTVRQLYKTKVEIPEEGKIKITIPAEETARLKVGVDYNYEIEKTEGEIVQQVILGKIQVALGITE